MLFVIFLTFSSVTIVLNVRHKRNIFNTIVLQDSNSKLDDLVWLLKQSLKSLDNPNFRGTVTFPKPEDDEEDSHESQMDNQGQPESPFSDIIDIDKQRATREKKRLLNSQIINPSLRGSKISIKSRMTVKSQKYLANF